ncbi:MAG: glycosyltransferase family 2 protein, partial [Lachnospiraceae bacterium]|nr:glycosyltransferase family 2 protein [Lachnospiraceae bacterium]
YLPDGSSGTMWKQYLKNPRGFAFWRKVCMQYPESGKRMIADCIHYVAESTIAGNRKFVQESPRKLLTALMTPAGVLLAAVIKTKNQL